MRRFDDNHHHNDDLKTTQPLDRQGTGSRKGRIRTCPFFYPRSFKKINDVRPPQAGDIRDRSALRRVFTCFFRGYILENRQGAGGGNKLFLFMNIELALIDKQRAARLLLAAVGFLILLACGGLDGEVVKVTEVGNNLYEGLKRDDVAKLAEIKKNLSEKDPGRRQDSEPPRKNPFVQRPAVPGEISGKHAIGRGLQDRRLRRPVHHRL